MFSRLLLLFIAFINEVQIAARIMKKEKGTMDSEVNGGTKERQKDLCRHL